MKCFISSYYGRDIGCLLETNTIDYVGFESTIGEFSNE